MDLGYSWRAETLESVDRVITDDLQAVSAGETLKLHYDGSFAGGLAEVVTGKVPGRSHAQERTAIVFDAYFLAVQPILSML